MKERLIPFPNHARSADDAELSQSQRRGRDARDGERPAPPRRARRRRQSTPWLQRNALSVAAISILIAFLGLGFGLLQFMARPDTQPGLAALSHQEATNTTISGTLSMNAASVGPSVPVASTGRLTSALAEPTRPIHSSVKVLDANYTIAAGDTLLQIALRFNTSVDRVQMFNNLADPRALRIGTKLVIPPPFQ